MTTFLALLASLVVVLVPVSRSNRFVPAASSCRGAAGASAAGLRVLGHAVGDMDGDGEAELVSIRADNRRPVRCQYRLVVRQGSRLRSRVLVVPDPVAAEQGLEPHLVGLAAVARGRGLEAVVDSNCCGAYVTGQWLFRETKASLRQMHVRKSMMLVPDTFPNGASLCCGATPVCGWHRGIVLVFGEGRYAKRVDEAEIWIQRRDTFVYAGRKRLRRPGRLEDFENCRPWIRART